LETDVVYPLEKNRTGKKEGSCEEEGEEKGSDLFYTKKVLNKKKETICEKSQEPGEGEYKERKATLVSKTVFKGVDLFGAVKERTI